MIKQGESDLDNNENRKEILPTDSNRQIQLVVNRASEDETTIDLGNVFHNMKVRKRLLRKRRTKRPNKRLLKQGRSLTAI